MALVTREAQAIEAREELELASQCGTWQQLSIMKRKLAEKPETQPATCQGMTRSQALLWYRANQPAVLLDQERCNNASNYQQLNLSRGVRAVQETEEEKEDRPATRSETKLWYRTGGREEVSEDMAKAGMCGNWKQYHLMTRGRAEPRDEDQEITRSERLSWYRSGGRDLVEARNQLCRESSNWLQYQMAGNTRQHSEDLTDSMNRHWSQFRSKEAVSEHLTQMRIEGLREREEIRAQVRSRLESRSSVSKPFGCEELQEEACRKVEAALSTEERIEQLRRTTEEMLTSRTDYVESTRSLAKRAIMEDQEALATSRSVHRTTVVQQGS